ncbi:MAG: CCA tRNA nucleotidyltransferase [Longimicrobiales bacterium]|nr:CCA tRNA nucleotidyltransferase [Longimicrobiales bacterium]
MSRTPDRAPDPTSGGRDALPGPKPRAPGPVRWIVRTLEEEGFETWTVGGAIRDTLLGHPGGDWDLATRARPDDVRRIFRRTVPIGIEHGTVGVLDRAGVLHEVTTFRRDVETYGRKAKVEFADSIEEDLARRDFTVNALAWHPRREELRDPFGGVQDLEDGILRTVGTPEERFREDYLRVLRALRFAGRFGFRIQEDTWQALCMAVGELDRLSAERIREELTKVLEGREPPSGALGLYAASGVLAELYPELEATVEHPRPEPGIGGVWEHALLTVDTLPPGPLNLRLAALLHGVGRPDVVPGHEDEEEGLSVRERAARRAGAVLSRLRCSNATVHAVASLVEAGIVPPDPEAKGAELRRWLSRHGPERLPALGRLWVASARVDRRRSRGEPDGGHAAERTVAAWRRLRQELANDPPLEESDLALDGRDLIRMGLKPGPHFGEILNHLLQRVLDDPSLNEAEALGELVEEYLEEREEGEPRG